MVKVYFIGAGPGDPELITVKGKKFIEKADLIIYTGSLVNTELFYNKKKSCTLINSASLTLDEVIDLIKKNIDKSIIARVHTGDPSIYGAISEQMLLLDQAGIDYEVIPGVSSFTAACSVIKKELTIPEISQTIICTRLSGRTPVPEKESLDKLASHKASMVIFLSVGMIDSVVEKLKIHYDIKTPVVIASKVTWKDEKIIRGDLENIADLVKNAGITKTALILVGKFLDSNTTKSKLYDKNFKHGYRNNKTW